MEKQFYTKAEIAEILDVDPRTIERYLFSGKLKGAKLGRQWRISAEDLKEFFATAKEQTAHDLETTRKQQA